MRHLFKIKYDVSKLAAIASSKAKHHREREKHYREEYQAAERDLKENGIKMMEHAAIFASGAVTGYGTYGNKLTPQFDQSRVDRVDEAKRKIQEHVALAVEFEQYKRILMLAAESGRETEKTIELDSNDVVFFGL